jgi:transposase
MYPGGQASSTTVRERLDLCERRRKRKDQRVQTTRRKRKKETQMKASSQDLRENVGHAIEQGNTRSDVVDTFGLSRSTVKRSLRQKKQFGPLQPTTITGRPSVKGACLRTKILARVEAHPDATFHEHGDRWEQESGMKGAIMTMSRAGVSVRWTWKKRSRHMREKRRNEKRGEKRCNRDKALVSSFMTNAAPGVRVRACLHERRRENAHRGFFREREGNRRLFLHLSLFQEEEKQ